ncbi:four-carbon acid sugar kinase family protein [Telluribacter sp.]|jgi:uncharacterized protein YgbK (DUF1537 family)|uniref:four-carbon acid sugar kinase family protein n=1 Tax=Telluribacter sp. TaxID=1978767 RepID=UPI002E153321|nr:four-carbon acid sugar kinase family protein [Telluribacter sp.]
MTIFSDSTTIVVLDDDPTGTQTVHNVPVLTTWDATALEEMFSQQVSLFYILTNSRAFSEGEAVAMNEDIGQLLHLLARQYDRRLLLISRSDSTLRGHFPAEVDALSRGYGLQNPLTFLIPAFIEGGRYTINGVHYLMQEGRPVPVAETPFAQDPVFGYTHSDLTEWVMEKSGGAISPQQITRVQRQELTGAALEQRVTELLDPELKVVIADAESYGDLTLVSELIKRLFEQGREVLVRSGASVVRTLGNLETAPMLRAKELLDPRNHRGGLVVVGSFVPLSTRQVSYLMDQISLPAYVVSTRLGDEANLVDLATTLEKHLERGETVLLYTQRSLQTGSTRAESMQIGQQYSELLVSIIRRIKEVPAFVVAKGGITSSDIATRGLGIKKAMVKGQLIPGVSVWEPGQDSRLSGFPYVVFPGNVGNDQALYEVVKKFLEVERS